MSSKRYVNYSGVPQCIIWVHYYSFYLFMTCQLGLLVLNVCSSPFYADHLKMYHSIRIKEDAISL